MKKSEIKERINKSVDYRQLCRVKFDYDDNTWFVFPLLTNDELFLCANEDDFILNGYSIRRFKDVVKAEYQDGKILSMIQEEKISERILEPNIDMSDWQTIFTSLKEQNKNIIVENEKVQEDDYSFVIGRIIKATKTKVVMQHFDADGIWEEELYEIPYSKIISVSFDTRYVNVFSKYL
ncbi:MAG: hypothetical protein II244_06935 [Clostridia bacterium]|nr:hypothetical protein [Clostridia bacterium]